MYDYVVAPLVLLRVPLVYAYLCLVVWACDTYLLALIRDYDSDPSTSSGVLMYHK